MRLVKSRFVSRFKLVAELVPESIPEARLSRWLADPRATQVDRSLTVAAQSDRPKRNFQTFFDSLLG